MKLIRADAERRTVDLPSEIRRWARARRRAGRPDADSCMAMAVVVQVHDGAGRSPRRATSRAAAVVGTARHPEKGNPRRPATCATIDLRAAQFDTIGKHIDELRDAHALRATVVVCRTARHVDG